MKTFQAERFIFINYHNIHLAKSVAASQLRHRAPQWAQLRGQGHISYKICFMNDTASNLCSFIVTNLKKSKFEEKKTIT